MDLNDVKAGKYQLVAVRWDQITSKPGEPLDYVRHRKGAIVDLNAEDAKRLVAAGAIVKPGQLEKTKAEQARAQAERAAAAIAAGCDLVLHCNGPVADMQPVVAAAGAMSPEACRRADAALALRRPVQPTDITALTAELRALLA